MTHFRRPLQMNSFNADYTPADTFTCIGQAVMGSPNDKNWWNINSKAVPTEWDKGCRQEGAKSEYKKKLKHITHKLLPKRPEITLHRINLAANVRGGIHPLNRNGVLHISSLTHTPSCKARWQKRTWVSWWTIEYVNLFFFSEAHNLSFFRYNHDTYIKKV